MNEYIIYQDSTIKIAIDERVHHFLVKRHIPSIKLSKIEQNILLGITYKELENRGISLKDKHIRYIPKAPVIDASYIASYKPPLDVFNLATTYMTLVPALDDASIFEEIIDTFETIQKTKNLDYHVYLQIYDRPINQIYGSFSYVSEKDIFIMFWSFKENPGALETLNNLDLLN